MRKVDKLGRIVIPQPLREKYGLSEGRDIEFVDGGDGIVIKPGDAFCRICHAEIPEGSSLPLCEACVAEVVREYKLNS